MNDNKRCFWWRDASEMDGDAWVSDCGAHWVFIDGTPVDNDMRYCPRCGGELDQLPDTQDEEE